MKPFVEFFIEDLVAPERAIYDLRKLATDLPRQLAKLSRITKRYLERHSWNADLTIAKEYLADAIRWDISGRLSLTHAKTALLHGAILGYARIFDTASNHRSDFKIGDRLSPDQRDFHDKIMELRHEALAHFGPMGLSRPWNEDHCLIVQEGITWQTAAISRRPQFDPDFSKNLQIHIIKIQEILLEEVELHKKKLETEIQSAWKNEDNFSEILAAFRVDPATLGGWDGPILSNRKTNRIIIKLL